MGRFTENVALIVALVLYVGTIFTLSLLTETSIFTVFVATLPILLYLIAFFYLINIDPHMGLLWILPLLFPIIFLFIWYSKSFYLLNMTDGPTVAVLNILICYVINIFILLIMGVGGARPKATHHTRVEQPIRVVQNTEQADSLRKELDEARTELNRTRTDLDEVHSELAAAKSQLDEAKSVIQEGKSVVGEATNIIINRDNFAINLRSIEDKCKAINFAIGRVYSDKRGASAEIREGMRIEAELYNSFSEITADFKDADAHKLFDLISKIHSRLVLLEMKEKDFLTLGDAKIPVLRDAEDRMIDVIIKNDKDPVADYFSEAKEICDKVMDYLKKNYNVEA